jgi:hypothetical protein
MWFAKCKCLWFGNDGLYNTTLIELQMKALCLQTIMPNPLAPPDGPLITGQYPIRSGMTTVGRPGAALEQQGRLHWLKF